jgi:hypothetical protein
MFLERWQNDGHSLVKGGPTFHPTFSLASRSTADEIQPHSQARDPDDAS